MFTKGRLINLPGLSEGRLKFSLEFSLPIHIRIQPIRSRFIADTATNRLESSRFPAVSAANRLRFPKNSAAAAADGQPTSAADSN